MNRQSLSDLARGSVLVFSDGYRTRQDQLDPNGIPILRVAEVTDSVLRPADGDRVSASLRAKMGVKTSRPGDVLVTTKGTVGRVAMVPSDFPEHVYSPQLCFLRVLDRSQIDRGWLYCWARSPQFLDQVAKYSGQTDMAPYLSLRDLGSIEIDVPPLDEQRRVAGVLGALDDLIEVNRKLADDCEALAQALAATAPRLTALSSFARWGGLDAITPSGQVDHYSLPAFDSGRAPERASGASIKSNKQKIDGSCVLVSRLNPHIPRVWMVYPDSYVTSVASTEFVPLFGSDIPTELVYAVCSSPEYLRQMNGLVTGTTGSHQRIDKSSLVDVSVPDVRALASSASDAVVALVRQAHAARAEMRELAATRDELLPLLMSGRVQVGDVAA